MSWRLVAVLGWFAALPALAEEPKDGGEWMRRGIELHASGEYTQAIEAFQKAGKLGFPPQVVVVRQVRAYSRLKELDRAFQLLEQAVTAGFGQVELLKTDADFEPLRSDARFGPLLARVERNAHPCAYVPEMRQFDFWVGSWEVRVSGAVAGTSRVERILDGCVLLENWESTLGSSGKSFNLYDTETKKWRQTWVDSRGRMTSYVGGREGNTMRFLAQMKTPAGKSVRLRMTFTPLSADQVRQHIEQSEDGKVWTTSFDGLYTRRVPAGAP